MASVDDIVQPVEPGTNWLFCAPFYSAVKYSKTSLITEVAWRKLKTDGSWDWLGGIDRTDTKSHWELKIAEGHGSRYTPTTNGFLRIKNVTKEDQNTEYRCSIVGYFDSYREDFHIKLDFREPEVKEGKNITYLVVTLVRRVNYFLSTSNGKMVSECSHTSFFISFLFQLL